VTLTFIPFEIADKIAVMYAGRIVETGGCRDVIRAPAHPYTVGLLASRAGRALSGGARLPAIPGAPPGMENLPPGCAFAPRCKQAQSLCAQGNPLDVSVGPAHRARCFLLSADAVREPASEAMNRHLR